jgi:hypothetical protein
MLDGNVYFTSCLNQKSTVNRVGAQSALMPDGKCSHKLQRDLGGARKPASRFPSSCLLHCLYQSHGHFDQLHQKATKIDSSALQTSTPLLMKSPNTAAENQGHACQLLTAI